MVIRNFCDQPGCANVAEHLLVGVDGAEIEACSEHERGYRTGGARHVRWIDEPAFLRARRSA